MPDRAVVAISEDRQWLVVLGPDIDEFLLMEWDLGDDDYQANYVCVKGVPDTGQSAEDVLREFLGEKAS